MDQNVSELNADADNRRKDGYVAMDSTLADIIAKRSAPVPSLDYLKYGDVTSYGQTFAYSEEMLQAVGLKKNEKTKGTLGRGSSVDGGAPWAFVPKELEEPIESLYAKDFKHRDKLNPLVGQPSVHDIIKQRKQELARKRVAAREEQEKLRAKQLDEQKQAQYVPKEKTAVVKVFSHRGVERRCVSAPPDVTDEALSAIAHSSKSIPMLATTTTANNPLTGGETGLDMKVSSTSQHLYPYQKQRLRHALLEKERATCGKKDLLANGWAESTEQSGYEKRRGKPELDHNLSPKELERIEGEVARLKAAAEKKKAVKAARDAALKERAEQLMTSGERQPSSQPQSSLPFGDSETTTSIRQKMYKPIASVFRPELPGNVATTPVLEEPTNDTPSFSSPPPWGRQTSLDDKWQQVRVFKPRSKTKVFEPIQKIEIDRELRTVRDQGLMKKEKRSLLKTMDARQIEYIKSLPADFGKQSQSNRSTVTTTKQAKPMKPAASIAAAYLK